MEFFNKLKSGNIKSIIIVILIVLIFNLYWRVSCMSQTKFETQGKAGASFNKVKSLMVLKEPSVARSTRSTKEPMADVSNDIKEAVKQVYLADVEAIRNLSEVATKLQAGGYTVAGDLTVKGQIISEKKINGLTLSELNSKITNLTNTINNLTNQINNNNSAFNSLKSSFDSFKSNFDGYQFKKVCMRNQSRGAEWQTWVDYDKNCDEVFPGGLKQLKEWGWNEGGFSALIPTKGKYT